MGGLGLGLTTIGLTLALATGTGLWLRRSGHRLATSPAAGPGGTLLVATDIGAPLGEQATLVAFTSAFCAPCRATRRVLDQVSSQATGVAHVEIDAESSLDLVRRLDVRRTPTVLVLDATGRVVRRASGQPRPADVVAALDAALRP